MAAKLWGTEIAQNVASGPCASVENKHRWISGATEQYKPLTQDRLQVYLFFWPSCWSSDCLGIHTRKKKTVLTQLIPEQLPSIHITYLRPPRSQATSDPFIHTPSLPYHLLSVFIL